MTAGQKRPNALGEITCLQVPKSTFQFKKTHFVNMASMVFRDLPFSQNRSMQSATTLEF
jgi:hypothetical protein